MKILITGALGHIGSRLIHSLKPGQFEEVILLDNLMTQRYSSLFHLPKGVLFKFFEKDICTADLNEYFKGVHAVIHLAAITDAASSFNKKEMVEETNYSGTEKVARACIQNGCRLVFPSTTSVYGTQKESVDENCSVEELKPQSPYAESKLKAEQLLIQLGNEKKLNFIIGRLGTIFGTSIGMRFHTAVNKFVWQACLKQPITVWKTAMNQKRPYLDLNDAISALLFIIKKDLFPNQVYNIVTANSTVKEILDLIKISIPHLNVEYVDSPIMNQLTYTVSNEKIKKQGFVFKGNLRKGIQDTIKLLKGVVEK
ncbi:MAG: SDR family oxidoreductase [bacterium]|nr:SDR family oxidoreductase [bacterium]